VVLQESENIEIGKNAKLVGNFSSEKELFLLFSRFAPQLRSLPFYFDRKTSAPLELDEAAEKAAEAPRPVAAGRINVSPISNRVLESVKELPDPLFFALVLLERESKNEAHGPAVRVIDELVKLLKARDLETLKHTHRTLFGRVTELNDDIRRAHELISRFFGNVTTEVAAAV
jgi:hypothetical protein